MSLDSRIRAIEHLLPYLIQPSPLDKHRQEREERLNLMLTLIPEDLQDAVVDAMENDPVKYEDLSSWLLDPFVRWVTSVPDEYYFPRAHV